MFTEFESIIKKQAQKITDKIKNKAAPAVDLLGDFGNNIGNNINGGNSSSNDYAKTPQKFNINGREIEQKKLLAQGAFGFIWLAEDVNTREEFALKRVICMTQDKIKSALLQKNIMQKLPQSPYIVKYQGGLVFKHDGNTVIITLMELCPGGNLFDMLQKFEGKGISQETIKTIASSVLQALLVLHKSGFIHRDIKIENVLIGKDKKMKICDFGSCTKQVIDFGQIPKSQYEHIKQGIQAFTTPMYRPPQIVDPYLKYKISTKADLWMLGCTLYTMCYFVHPFVEANAVGIAAGVYRFPTYPSQTEYKVSQKMQDFIRNLLTPNPQFRPSAQKMLQLLNKWQDFQQIPLNQQAKKLKIQHEKKEQQMKQLNKKVSKYDGDIPMEQLMKLQQKLKNNNQQHFEKQKINFITDKETQKISHGNAAKQGSTNYNFSLFENPTTNANQVKIHQKPPSVVNERAGSVQGSAKNIDVWSNAFTNSKPTSQSTANQTKKSSTSKNFDAFSDVFTNPTTKTSYSSTNIDNSNKNKAVNNANFYEFFQSTFQSTSSKKIQANSNKNIKIQQKQTNLLDL